MKPITVTWDGGVHFTADIRGHKVAVDQPPQGGGRDAVRRVAESCTVHHTLTHRPDIAVEILESPVAA